MMRIIATGRGGRDTDRLEAFSDGVIAIAITLLVLEIHVPIARGDRQLWRALGNSWPDYLGYLISFVIIGIMWANHHNIFRYIARTDHYLILINLLLLLMIGAVPFTTALLSEHLGQPGERVAVIVYSGWFTLTATAFTFLWRYASHNHRLLDPGADPAAIQAINKSYRLGVPGYLLAFLLAWLSPIASLAIIVLLALLYIRPSASAG